MFFYVKKKDVPTDINKLAQLQQNQAWGVRKDGHCKLLIGLTIEAKCHGTLKHSTENESLLKVQ